MLQDEIKKAVEVLRNGGVILYPTDTVWGIGCDATNEKAVKRVYEIKKRADSKSLVLLASDMDMICRYVKEVPEMAIQLVEVNDKPMTIIYPGAVTGPKPDGDVLPKAEKYYPTLWSGLVFWRRRRDLICIFFPFGKKIIVLPPSGPAASRCSPDICI